MDKKDKIKISYSPGKIEFKTKKKLKLDIYFHWNNIIKH